MLKNLTPEDNQADDNELHMQTRAITQEVIGTADDKEFTVQEVKNGVESMGKKAPMEDGIPSEVLKSLLETLPRYRTAVYNRGLREGIFPKWWKKAMIISIIKSGKEESDEVSKFRPKSLLDIVGKVLEKILINRINHHVYSRGHMNKTQFGFRPQINTIDAATAVRDFVQ